MGSINGWTKVRLPSNTLAMQPPSGATSPVTTRTKRAICSQPLAFTRDVLRCSGDLCLAAADGRPVFSPDHTLPRGERHSAETKPIQPNGSSPYRPIFYPVLHGIAGRWTTWLTRQPADRSKRVDAMVSPVFS